MVATLSEGLRTSYIGIDESNHGRYPEIFVAVFSPFESDAIIQPNGWEYEKMHGSDKGIWSMLHGRDYAWLRLDKKTVNTFDRHELLGNVVGSLMKGRDIGDRAEIFLDGDMGHRKFTAVHNFVYANTSLVYNQISIVYGKDLDVRVPVVRLADGVANYIFRSIKKKSGEEFPGQVRLQDPRLVA